MMAGIPAIGTVIGAVTGGLRLDRDGSFRPNHRWELSGRGVVLDATGCWITPGFVDAHSHLAWSDFDAADRPTGSAERAAGAAANQLATLRAGVTVVRDAGGYDPALARRLAGRAGPRVSLSVDIIGAADARGQRYLRDRVAELADAGAAWIKLAATGGVGAGTRQLEPSFSRGELTAVMGAAATAGLPVMVHAWGGLALDQVVDLGAASIEHAVFLTAAQAARVAASGAFVVPTVWIYSDVLRLAEAGILPRTLAPAARRAVAAHPRALRHCLDAGVRLAAGTDAGLASQHGRNLHEVAAMIEAGVPAPVALTAATTAGLALLGEVASRGDLVVFSGDPARPDVLRDRAAVRAVVQGGRVVHSRSDAGSGTEAG